MGGKQKLNMQTRVMPSSLAMSLKTVEVMRIRIEFCLVTCSGLLVSGCP